MVSSSECSAAPCALSWWTRLVRVRVRVRVGLGLGLGIGLGLGLEPAVVEREAAPLHLLGTDHRVEVDLLLVGHLVRGRVRVRVRARPRARARARARG